MHHFRCPDLVRIKPGDVVRLDSQETNHVFRILRMRPGEHVMLLDGCGCKAEAEILPREEFHVLSAERVDVPARRIHLFFAPPRKQKLDQLLKQAVELGVWSIVPMNCERSVAEPHEKSVAGRWQTLLFEACKQSGNPFLPELSSPLAFADAIALAKKNCSILITGSPVQNSYPDLHGHEDVAFFVGPEGGFSSKELEQLQTAGAQLLKIGGWTLRVETAVTAGIAVLSML